MPERSVWHFRNTTDDDTDILIFNPGAESGSLHIYTHQMSVPIEDVQERAEEEFGYCRDISEVPEDFARLEFGTTSGKPWRID